MSVTSLIDKLPGNSAEKGYFLYTKIPSSMFQKMEEENFRKTVRFVAEHSPFYRRKFAEHKIDSSQVKTPRDLGGFFTAAEDIRENPEEFICLKPDTAYESTGTTSKKPKRVYFSRNEVEEAGWAGAVGLWGLGLRPEDRVASSFDYSLWVSGPVLTASCKVLGCFHVEAGRMSPADFYERLADYRLSVIVGDPSWILALSELAEKKGQTWPIKLLLGGGENMTEDARRYIESVWKADMILGYGQTEAFGAIGMESREKEGYHLNEFHNLFEVVDRDGEGYGELVYTTLNRRVMPLIRYRSGDITRFIETPSRSGMPGRRIEKLKGRVNEWIPTGFGNMAPWMFEPVMRAVEGLTEDWQVLVEKDGHKDLIVLQAESSGAAPDGALRNSLMTSWRVNMPEAFKLMEMDFCRLDVRVFAKGHLRQGRKLPRLVDKRKF